LAEAAPEYVAAHKLLIAAQLGDAVLVFSVVLREPCEIELRRLFLVIRGGGPHHREEDKERQSGGTKAGDHGRILSSGS